MDRTRFSWLFEPDAPARALLWDKVLIEEKGAKSLPSRGSLVPGWLLTFSARRTVNLAQLSKTERSAVLEQSALASKRLQVFASHVFQFEHGAATAGSLLGCGLDIAHLHTVPLNFDLISVAARQAGVEWRACDDVGDPWDLVGGAEYYIVREPSENRALVGLAHEPTSQFFRKLIAAELGLASEWDYRQHDGTQNVERTVGVFARDDQRTN